MTFPNIDLQSLPSDMELRVGTDQAERALQLAYYQVFAAIQALNYIDTEGLYPEKVVNSSNEGSFDTAIGLLVADLVASMTHFQAIFAMEP